MSAAVLSAARAAKARAHGWRLAAVVVALAALAAVAAFTLASVGAPPDAAGAQAPGEPVAQTDDSVPAGNVLMIGSSPGEAAQESWGVGKLKGETVVVRYAAGQGWSLGGQLLGEAGQPLAGFTLDQLTSTEAPSNLAGQMTANGSGVLIGEAPPAPGETGKARQVLLVRNPGGSFQETAPLLHEGEQASLPAGKEASSSGEGTPTTQEGETPQGTSTAPGTGQSPSPANEPQTGSQPNAGQPGRTANEGQPGSQPTEAQPGSPAGESQPIPAAEGEEALLLRPGESLFGKTRAPLVAVLEEPEGSAGALVVPVVEPGHTQDGVLHWDGKAWTREPIEVPGTTEAEKQESGFQVLAVGASSPTNAWLLAEPKSGSEDLALYRRQEGHWKLAGPAALEVGGEPFTVHGEPEKVQQQVLTVTSQGIWIDGERANAGLSTTIFFKPELNSEGIPGGHVEASWCPASEAHPCEYELPEALPRTAYRSIAWANESPQTPYGERVITGFREGVSLRLGETSFTSVLALGGSPNQFPGGAYGASFTNPREGWLGEEDLPVHLTLEPVPSRLSPWPVSFRHTLLAIAPQPGAAVGSLSSQALAVGELGEVARYQPGKGWMPESLLSPGGTRVTPRLRAVAWPTPSRAYAVGDLGQMWLWRGETGLWERDPATPENFRGNLLGIAFDPSEPTRGYAVGQGGVLLRYGKTWTQEALPPQVAGASFTSVAFAGSEAIVAYRELPDPSTRHYVGGLLVNDGSGWHVDEGAAAAMGSHVPWAVAGLPDGGAAFAGEGSLFERQQAGAPWTAAPTPIPGGGEPNAIALFRENGAIRAIVSGTPPNYFEAEHVVPSPPGTPPPLIPPYPLLSNSEKGVLRQTATGWSDEEHELNDVREPFGSYTRYDTVYQPDPISTVLVNEGGSEGWAIGGFVELENHGGVLDTADVDRYPADGSTPPGIGSSTITTAEATFAIGGGAQCAAPCADRAEAGIGPDVWLSAALSRASQIGARAFLFTGPRVTTGQTNGPKLVPVPYGQELARYEQLLASSPLPAFPAPTTTDLDAAHSEGTFAAVFAGFPQPFGSGPDPAGITPERGAGLACGEAPACQSGYYAFDSTAAGGQVRVIVLDDSADVGPAQREWLAQELEGAKSRSEPAIAIGNANLSAQVAAGDPAAEEVARILIGYQASAYFFDSPEKNIHKELHIGGGSIQTFGSGTLGYVNYQEESRGDFLGASGFLLAQVDAAQRKPNSNVVPVQARLIPNIGELALEAKDGTLLRRSQSALFAALARRPRAGNRAPNGSSEFETDPYIPIPSPCIGTACAEGIEPEYTFSSSRPGIGEFVEPNLASPDPHAVLLGANGKPKPSNQYGLFCAYNAGTTIVTISAGGLSSSLPVTVQAGSVRRPCGTAPLNETSAQQASAAAPAPPPAPLSPAPASAPPATSAAPVLPVPPAPATVIVTPTPIHPAVHAPPPFFVPAALSAPVLAFVPPPVPTPARPNPPTGTSAVTSPVEVAEREEEEEEAPESVSAKAVSYDASEHEPSPLYLIGIVLLAALAGAGATKRRGRGDPELATATLTTMRTQRRLERAARRERDVTKW